jgi:hypothetical protein
MPARPNKIPKDAVLLIPEPEDEQTCASYGVAPGYYNPQQMLQLLDQHRHNADAIHFIADMLETGNPEDDAFAQLLRDHHTDPAAIAKIASDAGR